MPDKDVTSLVKFGNNDDEFLPLTKCVCGATFITWDVTLKVYRDMPWECPVCKRLLYFSNKITVYEIGGA